VQSLLPSPQISPEDQVKEALSLVTQWPGVLSARALNHGEADALLEPWLGEGNVIDGIAGTATDRSHAEARGCRSNLKGCRAKLADTVPGAQLDDHGTVERRTGGLCSILGCRGLVDAAADRAGDACHHRLCHAGRALRTHREIVEVVHMIGARDIFIAKEFQNHFLWLGISGGAIGLVDRACHALGSSLLWTAGPRRLQGSTCHRSQDHPCSICGLLMVPAALGLIAMITARLTRCCACWAACDDRAWCCSTWDGVLDEDRARPCEEPGRTGHDPAGRRGLRGAAEPGGPQDRDRSATSRAWDRGCSAPRCSSGSTNSLRAGAGGRGRACRPDPDLSTNRRGRTMSAANPGRACCSRRCATSAVPPEETVMIGDQLRDLAGRARRARPPAPGREPGKGAEMQAKGLPDDILPVAGL
jgi:cell division transport system permease protein